MKTQTKQLDQGGADWILWRAGGIGASEIPAIMGESEFNTPYGVWELKTGRAKFEGNFATRRGTEAEPRIRALYELLNDRNMPPCLAEHPSIPYLRASLDGYNFEEKRVLEIKYPSKEKHELAKSGKVPTCYYGQLQAQMFVTGATCADYVSYDGENIAVVTVEPDQEYIAKMLIEAEKFWRCVQTDTPPELTDRDYKTIRDKEAIALANEYAEAHRLLKTQEEALAKLKAKLVAAAGEHKRVQCGGLKIIRSITKGAIDYAKVLKANSLESIDLEPFRKKPSERVTISVA